jgi:hypothetical protein
LKLIVPQLNHRQQHILDIDSFLAPVRFFFFWAVVVLLLLLLALLLLFTQEYCFVPDSVGQGPLSPGEVCGENV